MSFESTLRRLMQDWLIEALADTDADDICDCSTDGLKKVINEHYPGGLIAFIKENVLSWNAA